MIPVNRQGEVWVFAEQEDGRLHDVSLELCGKARELADRIGVRMGAVLPGAGVRDLCLTLIGHGADVVYTVDDKRLAHYQTSPYARVVVELIKKHQPQIVMYGATPLGRDLAPRVASAAQAGMTADCTDLDISDVTDPKTKTVHNNLLLQIRPAFGGNIIATIVNYDMWPQMATVREGVMPLEPADPGRKGEIVEEKIEIDESLLALKLIERHLQPKTVNLKGARVIVAGGGGIGGKDSFKLVHELAGAIGGAVGELRGRRQRLYRQGAPDRPDRHDGAAGALHCLRNFRCRPAPGGHGGVGQDHRHQHRCRCADLLRRAIRHRRRRETSRSHDDQGPAGAQVTPDP